MKEEGERFDHFCLLIIIIIISWVFGFDGVVVDVGGNGNGGGDLLLFDKKKK